MKLISFITDPLFVSTLFLLITVSCDQATGSSCGLSPGEDEQPNVDDIDDELDSGGQRNSSVVNRMAGGYPVSSSESTVHLLLRIGQMPVYKCTGSLMSNRLILTAAHCLVNLRAEDVRVAVGVTNYDAEPRHLRAVDKICISRLYVPQYRTGGGVFDLAFVRLMDKVVFDGRSAIEASLPLNPLTARDADRSASRLLTFGVGQTGRQETRSFMSVLPTRHVPCEPQFETHPSRVCFEPIEARLGHVCIGDSGGPTMLKLSNGQRHIYGITSFGSSESCATRQMWNKKWVATDIYAINKRYGEVDSLRQYCMRN